MKDRKLILVLTLISIFVVVVPVLFAGGSKKEEFHDTWINEEYKGHTPPFEIMVFDPDGTLTFYKTEAAVFETGIEVLEGGWIRCDFYSYTIEDKWTDSDVNVWYKVEAAEGGHEEGQKFHLLIKISDSNRVLEYMVNRLGDYHEEIDPTNVPYTYHIYYRQE